MEKKVVLYKGKEKKTKNAYPFIFKDEIGGWDPRPNPGEIVEILDYTGALLGIGYANPKSNHAVRVLQLGVSEITPDFWEKRIESCINRRKRIISTTEAYRLVHAEADFLPGLIIDVIGDYAVLQSRAYGIELVKKKIAEIVFRKLHLKGVIERSDMPSREDEGLEPYRGLMVGQMPEEKIIITENGVRFYADIIEGHKTGYYADQRDNRLIVKNMVTEKDRVLDLFCYNGGFSMFAAKHAKSVLGIDFDPEAIVLANNNAELNGYTNTEFLAADAFEWLENAKPAGEQFDFIIIDPPAVAKRKEKADNEKWMFWRLVKGALEILYPGGKLVVSSCAYHLNQQSLAEACRIAASDVGKVLTVKNITFQPEDHPWVLQIPESMYLKTFFFEVS